MFSVGLCVGNYLPNLSDTLVLEETKTWEKSILNFLQEFHIIFSLIVFDDENLL
jgi:hypothetical protein